ncbi:GNAT family N-acetyltransferase [Syntrophus aciditrophicus]|uniref:GNAT family N-acetyltransferase n=1 Tax=Syntrophus aciditrophicus TaxID=316277 RepID=UPI0009C9D196|nr:GNAT family N-acetyltransferase [Syntrophus aciditrophicus]OPY13858.1 MAG: Acetyltransferase Pat [Syntrophus sp. PtaB.Bin075]
MSLDPEYARNYQKDIHLKSGILLRIRSIRPDDKDAIADLFSHLSRESIYLRFLLKKKELSNAELSYLTEVDFINHVALVAILPEIDEKEIVGVVRYIKIKEVAGKTIAEIGLLVIDEYQGKGIGMALLEHLAGLARDFGINELEACVLKENKRIRYLFNRCGYKVTSEIDGKMLNLTVHLDSLKERSSKEK